MRSTEQKIQQALEQATGSHGGLLKARVPSPEFLIRVWGLRICISNDFQDDAMLFHHMRTTELAQPLHLTKGKLRPSIYITCPRCPS